MERAGSAGRARSREGGEFPPGPRAGHAGSCSATGGAGVALAGHAGSCSLAVLAASRRRLPAAPAAPRRRLVGGAGRRLRDERTLRGPGQSRFLQRGAAGPAGGAAIIFPPPSPPLHRSAAGCPALIG